MVTIISKKHVGWETVDGQEREIVRVWLAVTSTSDLPTKRALGGLTLQEGSRAWSISDSKDYGFTNNNGWSIQKTAASGDIVQIKGTVASVNDLPSDAEPGWLYFVKPLGASESDEYVYTEAGTWDKIGSTTISITVDDALSTTSENPVQNKVITDALNQKADDSAVIKNVNLNGGASVSVSQSTQSGTVNATISLADIANLGHGTKGVYAFSHNDKGQITSADKINSVSIKFTVNDLDGTPEGYLAAMKDYFSAYDVDNMTPSELTALVDSWYAYTRDDWNGWTTFDNTGVSTGIKGGDNTGLICIPSTDEDANTDDYWGLPLFYPIDVNFICDSDGKTLVSQIDGITTGFERDNPDKFVGVMQMAGYHWQSHTDSTFTDGYSAQPQTGKDFCDLMPEANGRQFMVHAKYYGTVEDGKLRCYSGSIPTSYANVSDYDGYAKANGAQYGNDGITLLSFLTIMTRIKYASLSLDGIIQGCVDYNKQYIASYAETGVKRILIQPSQASNLIVGSSVLVGTVGSNNNIDRGTASVYAISGNKGCLITSIESVTIDGTTYSAVYVDTDNEFDTTGDGTTTTGNTIISTFHWKSGTNDNVKGNDGAKASPGGSTYPGKIQGVEFAVGGSENFGDIIIQLNPKETGHTNGYYKYYICKDSKKRSGSTITADYTALDFICDKTAANAAWQYIAEMRFSNGVCAPCITSGASSSTFMKDAMYQEANTNSIQLRMFRAFGALFNGALPGGLSCCHSVNPLSHRNWIGVSRLSASASWGRP